MSFSFNPGYVLLLAALVALATPARLRPGLMLAAAAGALYLMFAPPFGDTVNLSAIGLAVTPLRLDALSQIFGLAFAMLTAIFALYSSDRRDRIEDCALLALAGGAETAAFCGDLIGFVAAASTAGFAGAALAMLGRREGALGAGVRMAIWQGAAAILMTVGVGMLWVRQNTIDFDLIGAGRPGGVYLFLGLLIMAGAPGAHVWVKDAISRANPVGAAALASFPLTLAAYGLIRAFPGEPALVPIGAALALWPLPFAAAARDLRLAIGYGVSSQAGVMLIAIGAATPLAIAGGAAYAFVCALHSALAMMAVGLAYRRLEDDGQAGQIGGLARSMPITAALAVIAGLSALCAPFFAGFAARSVIGAALANEGRFLAWLAVLAVSAGAVLHIGVRAPYEMFFGPDRGTRPAEASFPAQLAMGLLGFFCVAIGTNPGWLYELLPEPISFYPFEGHLAFDALQGVVFAGLAFLLAKALRIYPTAKSGDILDFDFLYRAVGGWGARTAISAAAWTAAASTAAAAGVITLWKHWEPRLLAQADRPDRPGAAPAAWLLAAAALLVACLYIFQAWPDLAR